MNTAVAVVRTFPETVLADYARLISLTGKKFNSPSESKILLLLDTPSDYFFPASAVPPWCLEGFLKAVRNSDGKRCTINACFLHSFLFKKSFRGSFEPFRNIFRDYSVDEVSRTVPFQEMVKGNHVVILSTMKTHLLHYVAGALVCNAAFAEVKSKTYPLFISSAEICEQFSQLKESAVSIFGILDGTFAGDGAGPQCLRVFTKNYILASNDLAVLDGTAARMMGFDPTEVSYLKSAYEQRIGSVDCDAISFSLIGDEIPKLDFRFHHTEGNFSRCLYKFVHRCYDKNNGSLRNKCNLQAFISKKLFDVYATSYFFPKFGKARFAKVLGTEWGKLLNTYNLASFHLK